MIRVIQAGSGAGEHQSTPFAVSLDACPPIPGHGGRGGDITETGNYSAAGMTAKEGNEIVEWLRWGERPVKHCI